LLALDHMFPFISLQFTFHQMLPLIFEDFIALISPSYFMVLS
jgi:hypothetical protein